VDTERFNEILRRHLDNLDPGADIAVDAPLKELGLNSMHAIELLFDLEDEFGFQLPDEAMTDDTFETQGALLDRVRAAHDEGTAVR
jgi:acyl carrier protein